MGNALDGPLKRLVPFYATLILPSHANDTQDVKLMERMNAIPLISFDRTAITVRKGQQHELTLA